MTATSTTATPNELPAVAKNIYLECKKCGAERYHRVLAHTTKSSAKVECEICGSKKTYKLAKAKTARKSNIGAISKARAASRAAATHEQAYNELKEKCAKNTPINYSMKEKFAADQPVAHPKFGLGFIRSIQKEKIEVVFPDEVRLLVHNRS